MYDEGKHDRERIARLKTLALHLERLPQSRARDRLLREAHHRTVMLDTGVPASSSWETDRRMTGRALPTHDTPGISPVSLVISLGPVSYTHLTLPTTPYV